ncbi:unnamed protein product [Callosobruchus maculatus]|uniref:SAYSvFN domain-containing protein n=1 Tax=Callosobruchus maculatus TaxID=64391 RepID=A0A653DV75_CALMS|nr:unnamed protein product [Callosobruchus maculatus]
MVCGLPIFHLTLTIFQFLYSNFLNSDFSLNFKFSDEAVMNDVETRLAEYRRRKQRAEERERMLNNMKSFLSSYTPKNKPTDLENQEASEKLCNSNEETKLEPELPICDISNTEEKGNMVLKSIYYILCFSLWSILYVIFIKLQFGTVYLIVSCLIGMYLNTRTKPKVPGEVSAYSVFNANCESIDGTLKAEQFEREIRYGHTAVR